jgi:putative exporter of polyketide antibiotics
VKRVSVATFFFLSVHSAGAALVYWLLSDDRTGTVLLLLAGGLAAIAGTYVAISPPTEADEPEAAVAEEPSGGDAWWPLAAGAGTVGLLTGAVLGAWTALPGGALLVLGLMRWLRADED